MHDTPTFKYFPEGVAEGVEKGPEVVGSAGSRITGSWGHTASDGAQTGQATFRVPRDP
jgi:hypothetical protein